MGVWLYKQYYGGGGKGPTLRGVLWEWIKRVVRRFPKETKNG